MNRLTIHITESDIEGSHKYDLDDPVLCALQRSTGTRWHMADAGVALEIMLPARVLFLRDDALKRWQDYRATHTMTPFEFVAEFKVAKQPPDLPRFDLD